MNEPDRPQFKMSDFIKPGSFEPETTDATAFSDPQFPHWNSAFNDSPQAAKAIRVPFLIHIDGEGNWVGWPWPWRFN